MVVLTSRYIHRTLFSNALENKVDWAIRDNIKGGNTMRTGDLKTDLLNSIKQQLMRHSADVPNLGAYALGDIYFVLFIVAMHKYGIPETIIPNV